MIKTELSLEVSDSLNSKVMRLYDTSHYCTDELVENYIINVLAVNKSVWLPFYVGKNFSLVLNSSNLKYKPVDDASKLIALPDGIYEFKQHIGPKFSSSVHYYHFRITSLLIKINSERDKLLKNECKLSQQEYITNRDNLRDIREYADAAKWMVEECGSKKEGKELYDFSNKLLEQYTNECKC